MAKVFANSGDPDQTPHSAASDLGLHCLPSTLLWVSRLQWVNHYCSRQQIEFFFYYFSEQISLVLHVNRHIEIPDLFAHLL